MRSLENDAGQAMLLVVVIIVVLLLTVPFVVFLNRSNISHQTRAQAQVTGMNVARQGIAYAQTLLSGSQPNWSHILLTGDFSAVPDCNSGTPVRGPGGTRFLLACSNDPVKYPTLQPYQVAVLVTPLVTGPHGTLVNASQGLLAFLSQSTLAVTLPNGQGVSVALQVMNTPVEIAAQPYDVEWGPIAIFDPNPVISLPTWTLRDDSAYAPYDINVDRHSRKFSVGGITSFGSNPGDPGYRDPVGPGGTTTASDQKEYWAFTSLGFPPVINTTSYGQTAAGENDFPTSAYWPESKNWLLYTIGNQYISPDMAQCPAGNCGYFTAQLVPNICPTCVDTAVFTMNGSGYKSTKHTDVIFVTGPGNVPGNAEFQNLDLIVPRGAVIVTGNLTLGKKNPYTGNDVVPPPPLTSGEALTFHTPPTAGLEYPYSTPVPNRPWSPTLPLYGSFQGFLYVQGNLIMNNNYPDDPAKNKINDFWWVMNGAIRVDGNLFPQQTHNLFLIYDDVINHQILATPLVIQVDSLKEFPAQQYP